MSYFNTARPIFTVAWAKNLDPVYETGNLPIALGSPLVSEGVVYQGDDRGQLWAIDIEDGRVLWKIEHPGHPLGASPVRFKDTLIYGSKDGRLFARHYITQNLRFAVDLGSPIEGTPTVAKGRVLVNLRNHKLVVLDFETGKILWAYQRSVPFSTTLQGQSRPVVYGDKVFVGFADGYVGSFRLEDGTMAWEQKLSFASKFVDVDMTPLIHGNRLYIGSAAGTLFSVNLKNGRILDRTPFAVTRAPFVDGNKLLLGTVDGELIQMASNGKVERKAKVADGAITNLIAWKKGYIVSTVKGFLYFVDKETFVPRDYFDFGSYASSVFGKIFVESDRLVVLSSRNRLYTFK